MNDVDDIRRKTRRRLREVEGVLRAWDPIGVIDGLIADALPPNEYDDYAPHILGLLQRGATHEELVAHLRSCRTGAMGLEPDDSADATTAQDLCAWWARESQLTTARRAGRAFAAPVIGDPTKG